VRARYARLLTWVTVLMAVWLLTGSLTAAAPQLQEDDPAAQCAAGVQLFLDGKAAEALPLLEAGFAGREEATFGDPADLGQCALDLGALRNQTGDRTSALEAYAVALRAFRNSSDRRLEGITLNDIGGVYADQKRHAKALDYYQHALAILREVDDRANEGRTLNNISEVYSRQGRYAEALEHYHRALAIASEVGDHASESAALNGIGAVHEAQGRHAEALEIFQQALGIAREVDDRAGEGDTLNNIGVVYERQGRYAEALEVLRQALAIQREVGDRAGEGNTLNNIGVVHRVQGRFTDALYHYEQALAVRREVGDRAGEGTTLNNIGLIYGYQGCYAEALDLFQQALAIQREVGDRASEGNTLNNIGGAYEAQGRYAETLKVLQQALTIAREVDDRASEGITLANIGAVYNRQGRYAEALELLQQALVIQREVGDRASESTVLNGIGAVHGAQGRYVEALEVLRQALGITREVGDRAGETTPLNNIGAVYERQGRYAEALKALQQALAIQREVGDRAGEGATLHNIGRVYDQEDKPERALVHYEQAMDVFESVRAVAGSELGRASFIAQHADLYSQAVWLYHQQAEDEKAFFTTERGRARAFLDSLVTGHVELSDNAAADLWNREGEAYAVRQAAQDALARARALDPSDPALVADLETQLVTAEEEHAAALDAIEAGGDQLAALVPGRSTVLDLPHVQTLLDEQTTLLSYWVLEDQTLAFLITHAGFQTVALDLSREDLIRQIRAFRNFPNLEVAHPESAVTLYNALVAPVKDHLKTPHLAIVPHDVLHYLPFAALTDGERYLVDDYVITYLPSASALPFIQDNIGGEGGDALILGNPATADPDLRPLDYAEKEAQAIAELFNTQPLLSKAATEGVLQKWASQASVLHLAAHGSYNRHTPLYSAIALAPDEENDGRLEVREVYGLDLTNTDLVVLSACETQLGELSAGDEVVGLTRAFFFAGTPSIIATLWSVDDRPTALLMERFYTYLQDGMGKAEALREAQLDVREEYPNPYYWSAFVLSGDPGWEELPSTPSAEVGPMSTSTPTEGKGGGMCGSVGAFVPLALVGLWGVRRTGEKAR
jgi:CHAT domain-containing protein/tetratricopeptide (TPR) repeat protein